MILDNVKQYVIARAEPIICDQIVAAVVQAPKRMKEQFLSELGKLEATTMDGITTGINSADGKVHFHGAAVVALADSTITHMMQGDLDNAQAPQDAAVLGIMPTSRELIRALQVTEKDENYLRYMNINTANPGFLKTILKKGGLTQAESYQFMDFILKNRKSTFAGITGAALDKYLAENPSIAEKIAILGHTNIAIKAIQHEASETTEEFKASFR